MYAPLRWMLFRMDPERAHELGMTYLSRVQASSSWRQRWRDKHQQPDDRLAVETLGATFPGPLGLAAGFDKGARAYNALLALGFSHVEIGTVTPRGQPGNPKPRIERIPDEKALVNRLGFNNPGVEVVEARMARHPAEGVVGVNVGRNKDTPSERALDDYTTAAKTLAPHGSYVTVNVSSPNTPGLRNLQAPKAVAELITRTLEALDDAGTPRPVLLKLHPDAEHEVLVEAAQAAVDAGAAGIIATNTTTDRPPGTQHAGQGGLSGRPLRERANAVMAALHREIGDEVPLIGVGGIENGEHALERIAAGATLLQAYTAFIYRGPAFPSEVHREMVEGLDERGLDRIEELRGTAAGSA
ncbi:MAG: quinone-dependent dihydroorotate dehydrogenase [Candidatus Thermoplasmatota archaeon]|nr:quinone-dependent dihydroorotate dehydrogenase [Candidatus Thermoplasmatota archaeon]